MEEKIVPKDQERIRIVEQYEAGRRMLKRKGKKVSTRVLYVRGALLFAEFLGKNLDEIVDEYRRDVEGNPLKAYEKWEDIFADFADDLQERYKGATPATYFAGAVALINTNVPKSLRIRPATPEVSTKTIPPITIEDLRIVRDEADTRGKAFIDILKDTGISRDDAVELNYSHVKKAIEDKTVKFLKTPMYRKKENVEYETWLGHNAIASLRRYFASRKRKGETITDDTPIFASDRKPYGRLDKMSLSAVLRRLGKKTDIAISTHRLRKFFATYMTAGGAHPIVAKYWMGHKVKTSWDVEGKYIIPPENLQRQIYEKAYPYIDVTAVRSLAELEERQRIVEELTDKLMRSEPLTDQDRENIKRYGIRLRERARSATNGGDCGETFEQIPEANLLQSPA